ncbi:MAG: DNA-directed RNA polymerase subunit omega [Caldicoprobacterales bacterium]|jgi:DNA-directed RNA polymerase subunit omega|nr:DNA-directed RNA polymerase subunit omega [Clostridiales bacterium]
MIYPTLKTLMTKVDSKYTLVVAVAKRARQLISGASLPLVDEEDAVDRPVSTAIREIVADKVTYEHVKK